MKPLELLRPLPPPPPLAVSSPSVRRFSPANDVIFRSSRFRLLCSSTQSEPVRLFQAKSVSEYKPGVLDDVFLGLFRSKMVKEVGWDSEKPGYDGLIEVANRLMLIGRSSSYTRDAAVRILVALFPPFLLDLFKLLISPLAGGQVAAVMNARVTQLSCQWLMGKCRVNSVDLPDGTSWESGVLVERCKYLEQSKCVGICINTCKLPTQTFFNDYMGVPLLMEPNFVDYSCQFKFGVAAPVPEDDAAVKEPCLEMCPSGGRRRRDDVSKEIGKAVVQCPKA
ncbi:Beta-carotene isomerase D27, chloroplastic [Linum perenne]